MLLTLLVMLLMAGRQVLPRGCSFRLGQQRRKVVANMLSEKKTPAEVIDSLYLRAVCRKTSDKEREKLIATVEKTEKSKDALEDVFWAVLNSREFLFLK